MMMWYEEHDEEVVWMQWWGWGCREIGYYPKLGALYYEILAL